MNGLAKVKLRAAKLANACTKHSSFSALVEPIQLSRQLLLYRPSSCLGQLSEAGEISSFNADDNDSRNSNDDDRITHYRQAQDTITRGDTSKLQFINEEWTRWSEPTPPWTD